MSGFSPNSNGDFALRLSNAGKRYIKYEDVPTLVGLAKLGALVAGQHPG